MKRNLLIILLLTLCNTSLSAQRKIKVACIGDSITFGYTLDDPLTDSYPSQLQQMLGDSYEVGNFGKSGSTLLHEGHCPYMQQDEYRQAIDFAGDIVIIHLGINDTDPRNWPHHRDSFVKDYLALIDSFRLVNPSCRIIISRLTPLFHRHHRFESGTRDWHSEIQRAIETVAQYAKVQLMDFHEPLYAYHHLLPDAVHPDKEGAYILAKTLYSAITGDFGGLQMPIIYSDNMVLQRNRPLKIHGIADAGEHVTVSIGNQTHVTRASSNGKWDVLLQPLAVGAVYTLTIATDSRKLVYRNVLAGEVWLCSGQSNMEFYLNRTTTGKEDITQIACNEIRLFDMKGNWRTDQIEWSPSALDSVNHLQYYRETKWTICSPETAEHFSAVAYYFGKMLQDNLKVPVGLICNAVGGSPTEAWIDRNTLEYQFPAILHDWIRNDFIQKWVRDRGIFNMKQSSHKLQRHPYEPCYLFEAGIQPLRQFPIQGVIWYQGESNAHNCEAHEKLFPLLVESWRRNWGNEEMPFYFVQLSSMGRPSWTWFRDSQLKLMRRIKGTGMAVCSDYGDSLDVHPRHKKPVGERLARWALNKTYGQKHMTPSGPLFRSAKCHDGVVYVQFDYGKGLRSSDSSSLRTFEVAEMEGLYEAATAEVTNDSILKVYSPHIRRPRYVRYGWQPYTRANLINDDGLSASTFRAELPAETKLDCQKESFPCLDKDFAQGVSACFAGITGGNLLIAGGCNFPRMSAKDGGRKQFYRNIYIAELNGHSALTWRKAGKLPKALAYGVSLSTAEGVVCIGGTDGQRSQNTVLRISLNGKRKMATVDDMPPLPYALDNMAGAVAGRNIYVVGGNKEGIPCNEVYCLNLDNIETGWQRLPDFPGEPRIQPVCATYVEASGDISIYLWGGFAPAAKGCEATLSTDGYVYSTATGKWLHMPPPIDRNGEEIALGGGVMATLPRGILFCTGGVNKDIFLQALRQPENDYLTHPSEWYRFNDRMLTYDIAQGKWCEVERLPEAARAGATLVSCERDLFYIGGEIKPGVRTPSILRIRF